MSFANDGSNLVRIAAGGKGGGFLQIADQALGMTMYLVAPAKFPGNQTAAYQGSLGTSSGVAATEAQLQSVLSNLSTL